MRLLLTIICFGLTTQFCFSQNALEVNPVDPINNPLVDSLVGKLVGNGVIVENIRSNLKETSRALATFKANPQLFGGINAGLMMVTGVADTMSGANTGGTISRNINYQDTLLTVQISEKSLVNNVATLTAITTTTPFNEIFFPGQLIKVTGVDPILNGTHYLTSTDETTNSFSFSIANDSLIEQTVVNPPGQAITGCPDGRQMLNAVIASNGSSTGRTTDCATIQFDIIPATDSIKFNYVFASEEYNTFVCSNFNDIFGFFIRGPGIVGDQNLNASFPNTTNVAIVPGTNLPVSINTVNNGTPGTGTATNCTFTPQGIASYIDNTNPTPDSIFIFNNLRFNGLTKKLQAAVKVIPCQTYTLTLTISDVSDRAFDSGVFIEAGSLRSSGVTLAQTSVFNARFPYAIVDCNPGKFIFERCSSNTIDSLEAKFKISGTAVNGQDYKVRLDNGQLDSLRESFVLNAGTFIDSLTIVGIDNPSWNSVTTKTLVIKFLNSRFPYLPNGQPNYRGDSTVLTIKRKFSYRASNDIDICIGEDSLLLPNTSSDTRDRYRWVQLLASGDTIPTNTLSCTSCDNPRTFTSDSTKYIVFVKDSLSGCITNDTVAVNVLKFPTFANGYPTTDKPGNFVCPGSPFMLIADSSKTPLWTYEWRKPNYKLLYGNNNLALSSVISIPDDTLKKPAFTVPQMDIKSRYYYVAAQNILGCETIDSVQVFIPKKPSFEVPANLEICLGDSMLLRASFFQQLIESKVKIEEGSNLTFFPQLPGNSQKIETANLLVKRIKDDTAAWVIPKVTFGNTRLRINAVNCKSAVAEFETASTPLNVSLPDSIIKYNLNFDTTLAVIISSSSCGASFPSLVVVNGLTRNQGFYIYKITSDKDSPTSWPLLDGGSLHVFNRWGKEVYSTDYYRNELSHSKLTEQFQDGVYFYHYLNKEVNTEKSGFFTLSR